MTTTEDNTKQWFYKLSMVLFILFSLNLIIVLFADLYIFYMKEASFATLEIWRWDANVGGDPSSRNGLGYTKIVSAAMGAVALIALLVILPKIRQRWIEKERRRFATLIYFSVIFLTIARGFDIFFIISASDLSGLIYSIGQFDIPLDVLANAFYINFAYEIFLLKDVNEKQQFHKGALIIAFMAAFATFVNTLDAYIANFPLVVFGAISYLVLIIIFIFTLKIAAKVFQMQKMIEENQRSIQIIGIELLLFALMLVCIALSTYFGGDWLFINYIFRTIKECIIFIIAILYIPAFINPR